MRWRERNRAEGVQHPLKAKGASICLAGDSSCEQRLTHRSPHATSKPCRGTRQQNMPRCRGQSDRRRAKCGDDVTEHRDVLAAEAGQVIWAWRAESNGSSGLARRRRMEGEVGVLRESRGGSCARSLISTAWKRTCADSRAGQTNAPPCALARAVRSTALRLRSGPLQKSPLLAAQRFWLGHRPRALQLSLQGVYLKDGQIDN